MKKNILLLGFFLLLTALAYYIEEVRRPAQQLLAESRKSFLNINIANVTKITLENITLVKNKDEWIIRELNHSASSKEVIYFLKRLSHLHVVSEQSYRDLEKYFTNVSIKFDLQVGGENLHYRLGDVSEITGHYYLEDLNRKKIYTIKDTNYFEGIYRNEIELFLNKYLVLKSYLRGHGVAFINPSLLANIDLRGTDSFVVDNKLRPAFSIFIKENKTRPEALSGLRYMDLEKTMQALLSKAQIIKLYAKGAEVLDLEVSDITFYGEGVAKNLRLHRMFGDKKGLFVTQNEGQWVYELKKDTADIFFTSVSNYWDKRPDYQKDLTSVRSFSFSLSQDQKVWFDFEVINTETFEMNTTSKEVLEMKRENFNFLFHVLFSLKDFEQAFDVMSPLPYDAIKEKIYVKILGKSFCLILLKDKIVLQDLDQKIDFLYHFAAQGYGVANIDDFFTLRH